MSSEQALQELAQAQNFSSREYDRAVFSLTWKTTGCYQRGVLPVPLASNNTCLPGFYCKLNFDMNIYRLYAITTPRRVARTKAKANTTQVPIQATTTLLNTAAPHQNVPFFAPTRRLAIHKAFMSPKCVPMVSTVPAHQMEANSCHVPKAPIAQQARESLSTAQEEHYSTLR